MRTRRNWNVMRICWLRCWLRSTLLDINWDVLRMGSKGRSTNATPESQPRHQMLRCWLTLLPSVK